MSKGDITKKQDIIWGYTLDEAVPYLDYLHREILFREAILGFLGVKDTKDVLSSYCLACKKSRGLRPEDEDEKCDSCSKDIKIEGDSFGNRTPN